MIIFNILVKQISLVFSILGILDSILGVLDSILGAHIICTYSY